MKRALKLKLKMGLAASGDFQLLRRLLDPLAIITQTHSEKERERGEERDTVAG